MKYGSPFGAEEKLEGPRTEVADRGAGAGHRVLELLARLRCQRRRGRLLDELLMPPLDGALALAEGQDAPMRVAEDLHLDVAGR